MPMSAVPTQRSIRVVRADEVRLCDRLVSDDNMLVTQIIRRDDSIVLHSGEHRRVTLPTYAKTRVSRNVARVIELDEPEMPTAGSRLVTQENKQAWLSNEASTRVWESNRYYSKAV